MVKHWFLPILCLSLLQGLSAQSVVKDSVLKGNLTPHVNIPNFKKDSGLLQGKDSLQGQAKKMVSKEVAAAKSLLKIPGLPQIKGIAGLEGYHTNFQNPRVLSQPTYLRFNSNTSVTWAGLPFLIDAYYTTEKRTFYNSNHFSVRFDKETFIRNITQAWQKKLNDANAQLNSHKSQLDGISKDKVSLDKQQLQLDQQKQNLQNLYQEQFEQYKQKYKNKGDSMLNGYKGYEDSLQELYNSGKDSGMKWLQYKKQKSTDSLNLARLAADTQRIHDRIEQGKEKYKELQAKKQSFDSLVTADTAIIGKYKRMVDNPQAVAGTWLKENGFPSQLVFAASLKDFQTGNVQPFIHNYSMAGIGFRGLNTGFEHNKWDVTVAGGKGIPMDILNYDRKNNHYDRLYLATGITYSLNDKTSVLLFAHHASDPKDEMTRLGKAALFNEVVGLNIKTSPFGYVDVDASAANSAYKITNNNIRSVTYFGNSEISPAIAQKAHSAWDIKLSKKLSKNFELNGIYRYVGPMFKNLGNPYMRTNFLEYNAKVVGNFWKQQIKITSFYKTMQDNPLHLSEVTNKTQGYGLSFQTKFNNKQLPNFNFSISPYEQGNNHPDSLFRVNNRFSIITSGLSYRINKGFFKYSLLVYGTQSLMQFNDSIKARIRTVTINQDVSLGRYFTMGFAGTIMRTNPGVDSNQANIWQTRMGFSSKKGSLILLTTQWSQYQNGAFRKGAALNVSFRYGKHMRFTLRSGYDHYYRLWGLGDHNALWGLCKLDFMW